MRPGLFSYAAVPEREKTMQVNRKTRYIVFTGVLSLLATVLYFIEVPIFGGYLKLDFSDIPALLAGVMFGPSSGIAVELIKNLIHLGIRGLGDTFGYGNLMNFIVGTAAVVPYSAVMRAGLRKDVSMGKISVLSGAAGIAAMVSVGVIANYLIAPPFFGAVMHVTLSGAALWAAVGAATILNAIKSVTLALISPPILTACKKYYLPELRRGA